MPRATARASWPQGVPPAHRGQPLLEMRPICERCDSPLPHEAQAFICSFECTFCAGCVTELGAVCPNCGGELVARPRRQPPASTGS